MPEQMTTTQDPQLTQDQTDPATGNHGDPAPERLPASEIKKVPWVRDALQAQGELAALRKTLADAEAEKARQDLIAKGDFEKALAAEQSRYAALETQHRATLRKHELTTAFLASGLTDPRAVTLFENDQKEGEDTAAFVARVKEDPRNALYFGASQPQGRTRLPAPPAAQTGGTTFNDKAQARRAFESAKDPDTRAAAAAYLRAVFERENP